MQEREGPQAHDFRKHPKRAGLVRADVASYLIRPDLIELLWHNGSRFATLLNGIEVSFQKARP